jgi:hypothetical protein
MFNVGCDGIAGLDFPPSFDTLDLRDIHLWPYGTVGGAGGDPGLVRSGTGIYVPPGHCDNLVMDVVMVIGYNINFDFECNGNLDLGTLWADYPIAGAGATTIGVKFGNNIDHVTVNNLSSLSSYVGIQTNSGAGSIYISSLHIFGTISDCLQSKGTNIIVAMADITFCGNFGINASAMATSNIISIGSLNLRSITQGVPIAAPSGGTYANFKLGKTFTDLAAGVSLIGSAVQGLVQITSTTNLAPPVDSNIFEVTGANAITNILGTWGGRIIYLKFDAAATIVNSGNVNLTATYTACNGCVLTLLYDQAPNKWQVVSRGTP